MKRARKAARPESEWKLVVRGDVQTYQCGLCVDDIVRLREDLVIRDHNGAPTGKVCLSGETWLVLPGSTDDPGIVWFRQEDGELHTWTDTSDLWKHFERLERSENTQAIKQQILDNTSKYYDEFLRKWKQDAD